MCPNPRATASARAGSRARPSEKRTTAEGGAWPKRSASDSSDAVSRVSGSVGAGGGSLEAGASAATAPVLEGRATGPRGPSRADPFEIAESRSPKRYRSSRGPEDWSREGSASRIVVRTWSHRVRPGSPRAMLCEVSSRYATRGRSTVPGVSSTRTGLARIAATRTTIAARSVHKPHRLDDASGRPAIRPSRIRTTAAPPARARSRPMGTGDDHWT